MFPKHLSLTLTHNVHKEFYDTAEGWIKENEKEKAPFDWVSDEQKQKALDTGEIWTLTWYPKNPVGFMMVAAADLDVLIAHMNEENSR